MQVLLVKSTICAGGDTKTMLAGKGFIAEDDQGEAWGPKALARKRSLTEFIHKVALTIDQMDKPIVCGIQGVAVGVGLDMALICDVRVMAETAKLSAGYVKAGLVPGDGGAYYIPKLVGTAKALELLWTGDFITAAEAERIGLVNKCVQMIKRAVYSTQRTNDLRTALDMISSHMAIVTKIGDHREALEAMKEKRAPKFKGI